jgi:hypothetical protein
MRRSGSSLTAQAKAAHMAQVQASIGRLLRDDYDTAQPLPKRLADLVRQIAQPTEDCQTQPQVTCPPS